MQSSQNQLNYSEKWAEYVDGLAFSKLPNDVVHRMKRSTLDFFGVVATGSRNHSSRIVVSYVKSQSAVQEATIIPYGVKTSSYYAAFANGTFAHTTEMTESFSRVAMHAGNQIPPAAFAVAERVEASGKELITAMAAGYEIALRAAMSINLAKDSTTFSARDRTRSGGMLGQGRFWHPVPTGGIYGAAAAAAKLLQLDKKKIAEAFRICNAITQTFGFSVDFRDGKMTKDIIQGSSNATAVLAADLASQGFTGSRDVTVHLSALIPDYEPSWLLKDLGSRYYISSGGLHFRQHQAAGMSQSAADAVLDALEKQEVNPEDVTEVAVYVPRSRISNSLEPTPPNESAARLSIPYVVSAIIAFHDSVKKDPFFTELYTEEKIASEARSKLAHKIKVVGSEEFEKGMEVEWPVRFRGRVEIKLKSGSVVTGESEIWRVQSNFSDEMVVEKFRDVAGRVLPSDKVEVAIEKAFTMDGLGTLDELIRSVCV